MKIDVIKIYYERAKNAKLCDGDTDYQKQEQFLFWMLDSGHLGKLIERVQELETFTDESSKKHAELNVFLQRRKKTAKYLGKHVVNEVMEYAQDLESRVGDDEHYIVEIMDENKRYREAILLALQAPHELGLSPGLIIKSMEDVLKRTL